MSDADCVRFLQWALPRLQLRWEGFRKVRRQVCRRLQRRLAALGLADVGAYRTHLGAHPEEWAALDELCRITISRFYRDRGVFEFLEREVLPALAGEVVTTLDVWSAGCASGEEPYTLALLWGIELAPRFPELDLRILATDVDSVLITRAEAARYEASSLRDLPEPWRAQGFVEEDGRFVLRPELRPGVTFAVHDVRAEAPGGPFHLILCRNLAFTYFDAGLQGEVTGRLAGALRPGGALVVGAHERLPPGAPLVPWSERLGVYRRR